MARIYHQRHPEKTVLYRVLFHHFEEFLSVYERRFEKMYGYFRPQAVTRKNLTPGIIAVIQTFGQKINFHFHIHLLVTEGGTDEEGGFHKVSSFQVMIRYFGAYANAHRGRMRKLSEERHPLRIIEEDLPRISRKGWAEMIKKVYEVNPLICPECEGEMRIISFLTDWVVVDRIIKHLHLSFAAERPPPSQESQRSIKLEVNRADIF